jgi:hypothetical protein
MHGAPKIEDESLKGTIVPATNFLRLELRAVSIADPDN